MKGRHYVYLCNIAERNVFPQKKSLAFQLNHFPSRRKVTLLKGPFRGKRPPSKNEYTLVQKEEIFLCKYLTAGWPSEARECVCVFTKPHFILLFPFHLLFLLLCPLGESAFFSHLC